MALQHTLMSRHLAKTCLLAALFVCAWVCSAAQVQASCGDHVVWGKTLTTMSSDTQMQPSEAGTPAAPRQPCPCRGTSCQQAPTDHAPLPTPTKIVFERDSLMLVNSTLACGPDLSFGSLGLPNLAVSQFLAGRLLRPPQILA